MLLKGILGVVPILLIFFSSVYTNELNNSDKIVHAIRTLIDVSVDEYFNIYDRLGIYVSIKSLTKPEKEFCEFFNSNEDGNVIQDVKYKLSNEIKTQMSISSTDTDKPGVYKVKIEQIIREFVDHGVNSLRSYIPKDHQMLQGKENNDKLTNAFHDISDAYIDEFNKVIDQKVAANPERIADSLQNIHDDLANRFEQVSYNVKQEVCKNKDDVQSKNRFHERYFNKKIRVMLRQLRGDFLNEP